MNRVLKIKKFIVKIFNFFFGNETHFFSVEYSKNFAKYSTLKKKSFCGEAPDSRILTTQNENLILYRIKSKETPFSIGKIIELKFL